MILCATGPIHDESSVESGFESEAFRPRSRDLTTRPPRPAHIVESGFELESSSPEEKTLPLPPCSCKHHGIQRPLSSTLAFRFLLKPRRLLQS
ncbi:hypothetical protein AVEN_67980-1 [Araneus ventricosus]|uniref:Uncharacterized protein n=1 Tax=Araneus ventricosus TaxID=182803 RepID=A0A4Y2M9G2_ARAVE|nr:hypothetical protein AVEN_22007-1 [Araneus ventricosus]GBN22346.1 hypothetical protein AVEN_67980-1 [Araneus ventricosus]